MSHRQDFHPNLSGNVAQIELITIKIKADPRNFLRGEKLLDEISCASTPF